MGIFSKLGLSRGDRVRSGNKKARRGLAPDHDQYLHPSLPSSYKKPASYQRHVREETSRLSAKGVQFPQPMNTGRLPVKPSAMELQQARARLKTVKSVSLGDIDTGGRQFRRQKTAADTLESAHEFTDMMVSMRRGLTSLKAKLNENLGITGSDQDYARSSMNEWARRVTNVVGGHDNAEAHVAQATRSIYDNWRAQVGPEKTPARKREMALDTLQALGTLSGQTPATGVAVYDQALKYSPGKMWRKRGQTVGRSEVDPLGNFAYRINPEVSRPKHGSGQMSRLSLNIESGDAPQLAQRMGKVVEDNPALVRQSKIMGPINIGTRVDDAVVYLGGKPDIETAKEVDRQLSRGLGQPYARSAPPGMEPISGISSYAEYMPGTSSSHGANRGEFVEGVVKRKLKGSAHSTGQLMSRALRKGGYDPARPSRIMTSSQKFLQRSIADRRKAMGHND